MCAEKRIYLHYEGNPEWTLKVNDVNQTIQELLGFFASKYNEKYGSKKTLNPSSLQLLDQDKKAVSLTSSLGHSTEHNADFYVIEMLDNNAKKKCTHHGCGKEYTESENTPNSCRFHPGNPIFHEGRQIWSCCDEKAYGFDEFLLIPGCASGRHTDYKPQQPAPKKQTITATPITNSANLEVYRAPSTPSRPNPLQQIHSAEPVQEKPDPPDAVIAIGVPCIHHGCEHRYSGSSSRDEECVYHSGVPIFHEGSKGWSCCKTKVLDFDQFLAISGCQKGKHKFIKDEPDSGLVNCRIDFYQSSIQIIIAIYAKNVDSQKSSIRFSKHEMDVELLFKDGKKFIKKIGFLYPVLPEASKYEILSTKVEVILRKDEPISWEGWII
eukprot:TRINITY_DN4547_c0_g1_i4.p1 TRINITY_DN4547_c0_g1~~TRINITY_DN4547_c0_g1_i4.p1  ORF type:complete len:399 (-),score=61.80 TRINITY_DN4547_c0_g1_i4:31-1173(-)